MSNCTKSKVHGFITLLILLQMQYNTKSSSDGGLSPVPRLLLRGPQDKEYHTSECVGFKGNPEDLLEHF